MQAQSPIVITLVDDSSLANVRLVYQGLRFVDFPDCQKQHDRDINAAINIADKGLHLLVLGTKGSAVLGTPQVQRLPCTSARVGDVRPKSSGSKKSITTEAILNELGSLHCTARERVGSSLWPTVGKS